MATNLDKTSSRRVPAAVGKRTNDPEKTAAAILAAASEEFADKGLAGARIDAIAAATNTRKFMIYYYFENKEGLYLAVLEEAYRGIRAAEAKLRLRDLPPVEALTTLVGFAFDYHENNPQFVRLVMAENTNNGRYLGQSKGIREMNASVIQEVDAIYRRGVAEGLFRPSLSAVDIHTTISALSFHNVSNRPTFSLIFTSDLTSEMAPKASRRETVLDTVLRYVLLDPRASRE